MPPGKSPKATDRLDTMSTLAAGKKGASANTIPPVLPKDRKIAPDHLDRKGDRYKDAF
jgi:hypothetical protein